MNIKKMTRKYFKSTEEVISMFLGLVIVVVVIGLIFNFFQKRKGAINIPGSSDVEISQSNSKEESNQFEYIVQKGDNLWKIALNKYKDGYKWGDIAKANNLKNPGLLEVGQKLVIPNLDKEQIATISTNNTTSTIKVGGEYKVIKSDSLWKIAVRSYGDGYQWTKIWQANKSKLNNPNGLEIGMMLMIPNLE